MGPGVAHRTGKIGNFDLVYAGAYLDRDADTRSDYSDYSYWYDICCSYGVSAYNNAGEYINPAQFITGKDGYKMWSNELRISSPRDQRFRFVAGGFMQSAAAPHRAGLPDQGPRGRRCSARLARYDLVDPADAHRRQLRSVRRDVLRHHGAADRDRAATACSGRRATSRAGSVSPQASANARTRTSLPRRALRPTQWQDRRTTAVRPSSPSPYTFDEDRMIYATYSEGFRPGGVNRRTEFRRTRPTTSRTTRPAGRRPGQRQRPLQWRAFIEEWNDFQYGFLGRMGCTNITNAGMAKITGPEHIRRMGGHRPAAPVGRATWLEPELDRELLRGAPAVDV